MGLLTSIAMVGGALIVSLVMLAVLLLAYMRTGSFVSVPFLLSVLVVGLGLTFLVPTPISSRLPSVPSILGIGRLGLLIFLSAAILLWMVVSAWLGSGSSNPEPVARRVGRRLQRLVSTWAGIATIGISVSISILVILLHQGGEAAGVIAQFVGDVPLISSNIAAIGIGWAGAGGSLPVVGGLIPELRSPVIIAAAIAAVFTLAIGVTYADD